jgi:REP element-mobilizing transposase RayT
MPRKRLIYTHEFPYHIVARSNNRDWFKVELAEVWEVFKEEFIELNQSYGFTGHGFVLMSNHYHLIASCSQDYDLGYIMRILQTRTSNRLNGLSGRINHVYGGRYKGSLIGDAFYYANVLKYVFRNPVKAGLCSRVEAWPYSTVGDLLKSSGSGIPTSCHVFEKALFMNKQEKSNWLNESFRIEDDERIRKALTRTVFKLPQISKEQRVPW